MEEAREQATQDIKKELLSYGKCFLAFRTKLDPIMEQLVNEQLEEQERISHQI